MLETNQNSFQNLLKKQTVLVCPLDWGLGHATRCVPIIEQLLAKGHQVIIGADKTPLAFLTQAFPTLKTVVVPGYTVDYSKKGSLIKLLYESVFFFLFIKKEHAFIQKIIKENKIDVVISDNRYGLWSKAVKSILITHQIYVKFPVGERLMHRIIAKLIQQFDDCWIPDVDGEVNLSGDLSHLQPIQYQHQFIGALSRFSKVNTSNLTEKQPVDFDVIAIFSGPEPQRTIFEKLVLKEIEHHQLKTIVVRGLPHLKEEKKIKEAEKWKLKNGSVVHNHLATPLLKQCILKSKVVVCRAGYSSIMDLIALQKRAILIPTPGQTEQLYLAKYHLNEGNFYSQEQAHFDLGIGLAKVRKFHPKPIAVGSLNFI